MTQTGLSLGTPSYMSPEQAMGERTIDARSDIYALGAVTYEMLAGEAPFTGSSVQAIVAKVLTERPTPLHTLRDTVPPHVDHAVFTALAKLPADRVESAKAFADAPNGAGFRNTLDALPASAPSWRNRSASRWKGLAVGLGLIDASAAGKAVWALVRSNVEVRDVGLPPTSPLRMEDTYRNLAVAHDGSFIVYEAKIGESSQLWYRSPRRKDGPIGASHDSGAFPRPALLTLR